MSEARPAPAVLVVDDDDAIREITQMALEVVGGWRVRTAHSGEEALAAAGRDLPDVVLMDVMMPGMDGPTTCRKLREREATRGIPVILLTAKVQPGDRHAWDGLDVAGVIPKPFDPMTLTTRISGILGWDR